MHDLLRESASDYSKQMRSIGLNTEDGFVKCVEIDFRKVVHRFKQSDCFYDFKEKLMEQDIVTYKSLFPARRKGSGGDKTFDKTVSDILSEELKKEVPSFRAVKGFTCMLWVFPTADPRFNKKLFKLETTDHSLNDGNVISWMKSVGIFERHNDEKMLVPMDVLVAHYTSGGFYNGVKGADKQLGRYLTEYVTGYKRQRIRLNDKFRIYYAVLPKVDGELAKLAEDPKKDKDACIRRLSQEYVDPFDSHMPAFNTMLAKCGVEYREDVCVALQCREMPFEVGYFVILCGLLFGVEKTRSVIQESIDGDITQLDPSMAIEVLSFNFEEKQDLLEDARIAITNLKGTDK